MAAEYAIQLDQGYEPLLTPGLADRLEAGERSTFAGSRAVLVELPFGGWPQHAESSLFSLRVAGYMPVLAHPERYVDVQKDPELALAVAGRGVVLQLTAASFVGVYGKGAQRSVRRLLNEGLARGVPLLLATDADSDGHRLTAVPAGLEWIRRHPGSSAAAGWSVVRRMTEAVPAALLANAAIPALPAAAWARDDRRRASFLGIVCAHLWKAGKAGSSR